MKSPKHFLAIVLTAVTALYTVFGFAACEEAKEPSDDNPTVYAVTYARGASDATGAVPDKEYYEEGDEVTLKSAATFTRDGYTFTEWSDGEDTYAPGSTFTMPNRDVTFTAQWKEVDNSTDVNVAQVMFDGGNLVVKGSAGGGVNNLVFYLYDTNEGISAYNSTPNIKSDKSFTARIGLSQLTAAPGNWYYLMKSVNGGEMAKVKYDDYNESERYEYGTRVYKWQYHEGIAVSYEVGVQKSYTIDISGTAVRAEKNGHVYLSVSGTCSGYTEDDFGMDIQLQDGTYPRYTGEVTASVGGGSYKVKMDISGAAATATGKYYTIHLFIDGEEKNVAVNQNPYIIETSSTDDGNIYRLKSDKVWWDNGTYAMQLTVERRASSLTASDYLKIDGQHVKNNKGRGEITMLRGTNAGGYLVTEQWMTAVDYKDYKTATKVMEDRFGKETMLDLWAYYQSYYWSDRDFKNCADMGMNVLRLPFSYMNVDADETGNYDFAILDDFVRGASKYGIYTIIDLHGAYGSQNGQDHSGEVFDSASQVDFYSNATKKAKTVALWSALAEHYKDNPAVAAFDLLNEPGEKGGATNSKHWNFFDEMYDAVRAKDADRIVIFESCWTGDNLPNPSTYGWENCMYSFHHYVGETDGSGRAYTLDELKSKMRERIDDLNRKNFGVPLYMGEFTCYDNEDFWRYTLNLFGEVGWHYTSWAYKTNYQMGGWGIYYSNANKPNLATDSIYDIKDKWRGTSIAWSSEKQFGSGTKLKDIFKQILASN
ncbi:MAG: cellulase family glycosylhydrolase [Clostridiales bacterium]|nr:cellulase family glycosylhydrolase [Clostridiales bacterium]